MLAQTLYWHKLEVTDALTLEHYINFILTVSVQVEKLRKLFYNCCYQGKLTRTEDMIFLMILLNIPFQEQHELLSLLEEYKEFLLQW